MNKFCARLICAALLIAMVYCVCAYAAEVGVAEQMTEATESSEEITEPLWQNVWINTYVDLRLETALPHARMAHDEIYVPYLLCRDLGIRCPRIMYLNEHDCILTRYGDKSFYFFPDNVYAIRLGTALDLPHPPISADGEVYLPLKALSEAYGFSFYTENANGDIDLKISSLAPLRNADNPYSDFVHSKGIASETDYMLWVSKANFRVCLFEGEKGDWALVNSFPCAIGAVGRPTCEGQFRFYSLEKMWRYNGYYVGPIMRFNGAYALHSTLLRYDGTPYDNRVGVRISHGCVRLHAEDINYLARTVPLYSRVYITAQ